jgi:phage/plasmid-like protein (TIGR03299 family)
MHNLEQQADGTYSFVAAREPGWHNLGKVYTDQDGITLETILTDINAGTLLELPVYAESVVPADPHAGEVHRRVEMPGKKMIVRERSDDELIPLGIVGADRPTVDEREAFGFLQSIVDSGEALYQTAGLLGHGERAFCCMKLPEGVMVGGVDPVDLFLMIVVSHDASLSLTGAATPIRAVCQNTVTAGLQAAAQTWKIRHSKHMKLDVEKARAQLQLTFNYVDEWSTAMEKLITTTMTNDQFDAIVRDLYAPKKDDVAKSTATMFDQRRDRLNGLFAVAETQENVRGTAYAGFQALVEDLDWFTSTRNVPAADKDTYMFQRSITEGATPEKTAAFKKVMAFAS